MTEKNTSDIDQLRDALVEFDGKNNSVLTQIFAQFGNGADFLSQIVSLLGDKNAVIVDGASWLLKHVLENGAQLTEHDLTTLLSTLPRIGGWQAQLHICQSARYFRPTVTDTIAFAQWLGPLLAHKRPFIRAWSLDALMFLADINPLLNERAATALEVAQADEAASVRARARNLELPKLGK